MNKYIYTDELKSWVENWFYMHKNYHPYSKSNNIPITELYDILERIPTADVRENVHGEWIKNEDRLGWHCSVCKVDDLYAYSWNNETGKYDFQDNYCPNCGAKMKGDGNDDDNRTD